MQAKSKMPNTIRVEEDGEIFITYWNGKSREEQKEDLMHDALEVLKRVRLNLTAILGLNDAEADGLIKKMAEDANKWAKKEK